MPTNHLKRIAAPNTWVIRRKENKYITRPRCGPHSMRFSMALSLVMRELVPVARTSSEAKKILNTKDVFVDRRRRTDTKYPAGLMDIIEFPQLEEHYRMFLDAKGRLTALKASAKEANLKLSRIESKTKLAGGKIQLNMFDGRNLRVDKDTYTVGDTLLLSLPDQKITEHFKLEKDALVLLTGGKHAGMTAKVEEINKNMIIVKSNKNQKFETAKSYAFVIGKDKPALDSIKQTKA